jgi:hypothetical protein
MKTMQTATAWSGPEGETAVRDDTVGRLGASAMATISSPTASRLSPQGSRGPHRGACEDVPPADAGTHGVGTARAPLSAS